MLKVKNNGKQNPMIYDERFCNGQSKYGERPCMKCYAYQALPSTRSSLILFIDYY